MTRSNLTLSIGTAFALMFIAAPAMAQMGGADNHDQARHDDNGGMDRHDMNNGGDMNRDHNGGDRMGHDDHGDRWGGGYHHRHCRVFWRHHHRVRRCW